MSSILTRQGTHSDGPVVTHCGVNDAFQFTGRDTVRTVKRPRDKSVFGTQLKPRSSSQAGDGLGKLFQSRERGEMSLSIVVGKAVSGSEWRQKSEDRGQEFD